MERGGMLQQSDVDVLLATLLASQESGAVRKGRVLSEVKIYDFARPDNMPSEIIRALESVNTHFARALSGMLTASLLEPVQIEPLSSDQMTFRQFCNAIPEVTAAGTFSMNASEDISLIELNPHLAWYIVERSLGGHGEILESLREFTPLEKGLLEDLFRRMLRELNKAWDNLSAWHFSLQEVISSPSTAHIAQPDDRMIVCSFGITLASVTGMSYYAIPVSGLDFDRLLSGARNQEMEEEEENSPELDSQYILDNLFTTPVSIRVCFRDIELGLGELSTLREGDTIQLDTEVGQCLEVRVENQPRFSAHPVTVKDKLAIEIADDYVEEH